MENKRIRVINFDLKTKELKKYYPRKNYRAAYKDIKNFLCKRGFYHRQWSGYISNEPMNKSEILRLVDDLSSTYSWLSKCVRRFDVTIKPEKDEEYDMIPQIENKKPRMNIKKKVQHKETNDFQEKGNSKLFDVNRLHKQARIVHQKSKEKSIDKGTKKHGQEL